MAILDARKTKPLEGGASFSLSNRVYRALWQVSWAVLAAWTPPPFFAWRTALLRVYGANIAPSARVYGKTRVWYPPNLTMAENALLGPGVNCYNQARISIGAKAVVSQGAHLCAGTHDINDPNFQLIAKSITIGAGAWVAAEAFIGPGVTIGDGAVLGARGVAFRDIEPWAVYAGNPAKKLKDRPRF
jgi:putative colanic acid biosynthesis acetyltransferase WcaF